MTAQERVAGLFHVLVLAAGFGMVAGTVWLAAQAPLVEPERSYTAVPRPLRVPATVPTMTAVHRAAFPDCTPVGLWPAGQGVRVVLVLGRDGQAARLGFDRAWQLVHDGDEMNDVWVIGACR